MGIIYIFRGKAATGKTTITDLLSKQLNIPILRKDDIHDKLAMYNFEHSEISNASYAVLTHILQTNIENNCSMIVDIALSNNLGYKEFLSNIQFGGIKVFQFLCICSDNEEWKRRIEQRFINPAPNQLFRTVEEAQAHYNKCQIIPLENEHVIDSTDDISAIMRTIYEATNLKA